MRANVDVMPRKKLLTTLKEGVVTKVFWVCAFISILTTVGINFILITETFQFFREVSLWEFFGTATWTPLFEPKQFGIWPLIAGTCLIALGSCIVALPLGLGIGIFLAEYASPGIRRVVKPILEILAGIPSVVYGYFALTSITPLLQDIFEGVEVFNAASASIVVGIMVLPMVASICDDTIRSVPKTLRDGGYALGATKYEVTAQVVVPSALSGILASFILAFSRAIGETMAVTLAAGGTAHLTINPFEGIQTLTSYIAQVSLGDTPHGSIEYQSLFAVGMVLFLMTLFMNNLSHYVVKRFGRRYE